MRSDVPHVVVLQCNVNQSFAGRWEFSKDLQLRSITQGNRAAGPRGQTVVIEVEIQNEERQTQDRLRFSAVPRIGEGIRLKEPNGFWASYDVLDVWYQKAEYGEVWVPYLHVRMTPADSEASTAANDAEENEREVVPFRT